MKRIPTLSCLVIFLFVSFNLIGQKDIEIINKPITMSKGERPAYIVEIPEADYKYALKSWKKLIRQNTKSKVEEVERELIIEGTFIDEIYNEPITLYSAIINGDSSLKLIAIFEIDSAFFDYSKTTKSVLEEKTHTQIQHFLRNFAVGQYIYAVEEEFATEDEKLKTLNKELTNLGKENENLLKEIKENEQDIRNTEDGISSYEIDNERKQNEINSKKTAIAGINNDPELLEQGKSQLKTLEKEKNGIENKLGKEQKNIVKYQANIESLNLEVERNLEKQNIKKDEINKQELDLETVRKKLHGIK